MIQPALQELDGEGKTDLGRLKVRSMQWPDSLCHRALLSLLPQRATRTSCLDSINNVRSIKVL